MSTVKETVWEIQPHTEAKHAILKHYLGAWFPILANGKEKRIVFVDGFAGPGIYKKGEPGSPIVALDTARTHKLKLNAELFFWFIEAREDRYESLVRELGPLKQSLPANFKIHHECCKFDETMTKALDEIEGMGSRLAPSFVFIDPFGFSGTPMSVISRIMKNRKCEVLITFMVGAIDRFKSRPELTEDFDELFGTQEWVGAFEIDDYGKRIEFLRTLYESQLHKSAGAKYVMSFDMQDTNRLLLYSLIHGTNSIKGLVEMKRAFWSIDATGNFRFCDRTQPGQTILFGSDITPLIGRLIKEFGSSALSVDDLDFFVDTQTHYIQKHLNQALKEMENSDPPRISVEVQGTRKGQTYPRGKTQIRLL